MRYLVIAALLLATVAPAHAYIDAGSGSYLLQMSMAGLLALVFTIKLAWQRIKTCCSSLFSNNRNAGTRIGG